MAVFLNVLAEVEHRLEQRTNPTFDRGTVQALVNDFRLIGEQHRALIRELEDEIDRQSEAIDDYEEEAAADHQMIAVLRAENRNLRGRLDGSQLQPLVAQLRTEMLAERKVLRPVSNSIEAVHRRLYQD